MPYAFISTAALSLALAATSLHAGEVEKGVSEAPPNAVAVAGTYRCRDGNAYNVTLTLSTNGTYLAKGTSCLRGKGGASGAGAWRLTDKTMVLIPSEETGWMAKEPKAFNVLKFKGGWILVRADWPDYYNEHGVTDLSCFQRPKPENLK